MASTLQRRFPDSPGETLEEKLLRAQARRAAESGPGRMRRLLRFLGGLGRPVPRTPPRMAEALPWLLPKVRPLALFEAYARGAGAAGPVCQPLAGGLGVSLVVDLPDGDLDLGPDELRAWKMDFDRLLVLARSNLLARSGPAGLERVAPGRYRSSWRDGLDGSRLLLPGILRRLDLAGDPVAVLPDRDTLLVVGADDPAGLAWALEGALQAFDTRSRAWCGTPLRMCDLRWQPLRLPEDHPVAALLARMERRRLLNEAARGEGPRQAPEVLPARLSSC